MDDFGPATGLKAFDAFPKVDRHFRAARTARGAVLSIVAAACLAALIVFEFSSYLKGYDIHEFYLEPFVQSHLQLNVDLTIAMPCDELQINAQDATMDLIQAGESLVKEAVEWDEEKTDHLSDHRVEEHQEVDDVLRLAKKASRRRHRGKSGWFGRESMTRLSPPEGFDRNRHAKADGNACRIYGSLDVHYLEGDFHVTALGIGYPAPRMALLENLNFTHRIDRMSFGDHYPDLTYPLDHTHADAEANFHRFQYFLNTVATSYIYPGVRHVETFQYAVTESSRYTKSDRAPFFPGIFIKYDIEPIHLMHTQRATQSFLQFVSRLLGCIGGIVAGLSWLDRAAGRVRSLRAGRGVDDDDRSKLDGAVEGGRHYASPPKREESYDDGQANMSTYDANGGYAHLLDRRRQNEYYS